ncbi:plasmid mobilization protein [Pedobacter sp. GR22-10]|uniref:plasmid mobilization protein n=1 Tax=Pedobacter sp. GR22-10 TaxID=2994472 RepID=UPI002245897E|nr:plasmid mobilization relaxosome protein MobC [Pedobacter sp. GR22-10]MCX2429672.1 plasmid mobilization relaxosome protein MobC [Pedobacter sp. GR22-10]
MRYKGRPPLVSGKRVKKIDVRFTHEEFELILQMEQSSGMKKADLIRRKLLREGERLLVDSKAVMNSIDGIGLELSKAGNNVNQLARYANILNKDGLLSAVVVDRFLLELRKYNKIKMELERLMRKLIRLLSS